MTVFALLQIVPSHLKKLPHGRVQRRQTQSHLIGVQRKDRDQSTGTRYNKGIIFSHRSGLTLEQGSRVAEESPSSEILKAHLDKVSSNLICWDCFEQGVGLEAPRRLFHPQLFFNSMILNRVGNRNTEKEYIDSFIPSSQQAPETSPSKWTASSLGRFESSCKTIFHPRYFYKMYICEDGGAEGRDRTRSVRCQHRSKTAYTRLQLTLK